MTVFTKPSITVNPLISGLKATLKTRLNFPLIAMASRTRATTIPSSLFIDPANHPDFEGSVDQLNWKFHVESLQKRTLGGNRRQSLEHFLLQVNIHWPFQKWQTLESPWKGVGTVGAAIGIPEQGRNPPRICDEFCRPPPGTWWPSVEIYGWLSIGWWWNKSLYREMVGDHQTSIHLL